MKTKTKIIHLSTSGKILLFGIAVLIAGLSLFYTTQLVEKLKKEEKQRIQLWAMAYKDIIATDLDQIVSPISFKIIQDNKNIPVIMTDEKDNIISFANLDSVKSQSGDYVKQQLLEMKKKGEPIVIKYSDIHKNYIYYKDSNLLVQLMRYPFSQVFFVVLFVAITYFLLIISKRAEDNRIWVGMSKETAHQLGTPISSLIAWVEMMKIKQHDDPLIPEIVKDVKRLEIITERFARIGSEPKLKEDNLIKVIYSAIDYLRPRTSSKVKYIINQRSDIININLNVSLFQWVMENLCKNAIDAMGGSGQIIVAIQQIKNTAVIDVKDTGKGMTKNIQRKIFKAGYSSKKHGWGLGLALVKRIIEEYHGGKIFVLKSEQDAGTTFRIELPVIK